MAKDRDIKNTLGDTAFGSSTKDLADGDFGRGYFNAEPKGDYEHSLEPRNSLYPVLDDTDDDNAAGFVHRPRWKGDVERN